MNTVHKAEKTPNINTQNPVEKMADPYSSEGKWIRKVTALPYAAGDILNIAFSIFRAAIQIFKKDKVDITQEIGGLLTSASGRIFTIFNDRVGQNWVKDGQEKVVSAKKPREKALKNEPSKKAEGRQETVEAKDSKKITPASKEQEAEQQQKDTEKFPLEENNPEQQQSSLDNSLPIPKDISQDSSPEDPFSFQEILDSSSETIDESLIPNSLPVNKDRKDLSFLGSPLRSSLNNINTSIKSNDEKIKELFESTKPLSKIVDTFCDSYLPLYKKGQITNPTDYIKELAKRAAANQDEKAFMTLLKLGENVFPNKLKQGRVNYYLTGRDNDKRSSEFTVTFRENLRTAFKEKLESNTYNFLNIVTLRTLVRQLINEEKYERAAQFIKNKIAPKDKLLDTDESKKAQALIIFLIQKDANTAEKYSKEFKTILGEEKFTELIDKAISAHGKKKIPGTPLKKGVLEKVKNLARYASPKVRKTLPK